jgi:hypothetical protein
MQTIHFNKKRSQQLGLIKKTQVEGTLSRPIFGGKKTTITSPQRTKAI